MLISAAGSGHGTQSLADADPKGMEQHANESRI